MIRAIVIVTLVLALTGCGSEVTLPPPTEVEGVVLLGGQPLPNATVSFHPTQSRLPANSTATGVTDAQGRFKLTVGNKPGAIPGENIVTVTEGPVPEEMRGQDAQAKLAAFQAEKKNRPIPKQYGNAATSSVRVTVTNEQKEYKIELNR